MTHETEILIELYKRKNHDLLSLFQKQQDALNYLVDQKTNEILYGGGARGGKSWLGCEWQILNRLSMPESFGLIAREELTKLRDTTLKTFFKVAKSLQLEKDIDFKYNAQSYIIEFKNGSLVYFREIKYVPSDEEFDRFGSYDLTDVFLDEAQQIHWKAREVLRGRLSVLKGKDWKVIPKAFYSCNPAKNWIYNDFVKPYNEHRLDGDKAFIPSLATDNPYVDQDYIENLRKADKVTKERLLYGNFEYDDDPSALCDYDAICDMFTNDHVKEGLGHITADLAMQGRDKFISMFWSGLIGHIAIKQNKSTGKSIEYDLTKLKTEKAVPNSRIIADSDGLGNYLSSYIKNIKTFHGGSSPKDSQFGNLKDECGFKLAELINKREIKIICSREDEEEIKKQVSICLKRDNVDIDKKRLMKKAIMKEKLGYSPDYLDNLIMRMLVEVKKPFNAFV